MPHLLINAKTMEQLVTRLPAIPRLVYGKLETKGTGTDLKRRWSLLDARDLLVQFLHTRAFSRRRMQCLERRAKSPKLSVSLADAASRTMSLASCEVALAVLVMLMCMGQKTGALLEETERSVVPKDSVNSGVGVVEKRTLQNDVALAVRQDREGSLGPTQDTKRKKGQKKQKGFMEKMLPMMIIPFLVSTSVIPMMLISLKIMILKSAFIGKIAILLILLNMFRRRTNGEGGVFNYNLNANDVAMEHYGYHGGEEYGAYVNRRKRRAIFFS